MLKEKEKEKFLSVFFVALTCMFIVLAIQIISTQSLYAQYTLYTQPSLYTNPFSFPTANSSFYTSSSSLYQVTGSSTTKSPVVTPVTPATPVIPIQPVRPISIKVNIDDAELTGDMLVNFDAEPSPYPAGYDYLWDGQDTYQDIEAYIHTPAPTSNCTKNGQAIFSFHISSPGIYKVREYVWAKDSGHDSFFVEIKKGNKRMPFTALTMNPYGNTVLVKRAHDRFELTGQYNTWHWKNVCHWNAYQGTKEIANTCYWRLPVGDYKLIYSTREHLTRLGDPEIVKVSSLVIANPDESTFDDLKKYFNTQIKTDLPILPLEILEPEYMNTEVIEQSISKEQSIR